MTNLQHPVMRFLFWIFPSIAAAPLLIVAAVHRPVPEMLIAIAPALALLLRRRWPLTVLAVVTAGFVVTLDLPPLAFATYAVTAAPRLRWPRARWSPAALLVIIPATYAWHASRPDAGAVDLPALVTNVAVILVLCVAVPIAIGMLVRSRRDQAATLAELQQSRDREAHLIADMVRIEERTALARDMHDIVSDKISLITVRAWTLINKAPTEEIRAEAETIRSLSKTTLHELREMVQILRDPDQTGTERLSAIPELVGRSGMDVTLRLDSDLREGSWSTAAQRTAYRTVQEALTNVRKHAANARTEVSLTERDHQLIVLIINEPATPDTPSPDLPTGGHGLTGLRERAALIGGVLRAEPTEAGGFEVELRIPASEDDQPSRWMIEDQLPPPVIS